MAFLISTALDRLFALTNKTTADSNLPTGMLAAATAAAYAACQEARVLNPAMFAVRRRITLHAPTTFGFTLSGDGFTYTGSTGTLYRAGCTILVTDATYHNQVQTVSGATGTLARVHTTLTGTFSSTAWEDCWTAGSGNSSGQLDRIIGDVFVNGRPIYVLADASELALLNRRTDFASDFPITPRIAGQYYPLAYPYQLWTANQWGNNSLLADDTAEPGYREPYESDRILACWPETRLTGAAAVPETMLRFAPMPSVECVVDLTTVSTPTATTSDIGFPDGMQEVLYMPLLMNQWMQTAWFKPDAEQAKSIRDAYQTAVRHIRAYRQLIGAQPFRTHD